jgi:hypothetical protein|tara:strand:- start:364 stop:561 length:198 start_codon:yes stop_codon:yes gene_type:complete
MNKTKKLFCEKEVETIYGLNARTLQRDRTTQSGIPYLKIGRRIRYHIDDIEKYLQQCKVGDVRYD